MTDSVDKSSLTLLIPCLTPTLAYLCQQASGNSGRNLMFKKSLRVCVEVNVSCWKFVQICCLESAEL